MQDESSKQVKEVRSLKEQIETLKRELKDTAEALKTKEGVINFMNRQMAENMQGKRAYAPTSAPAPLSSMSNTIHGVKAPVFKAHEYGSKASTGSAPALHAKYLSPDKEEPLKYTRPAH